MKTSNYFNINLSKFFIRSTFIFILIVLEIVGFTYLKDNRGSLVVDGGESFALFMRLYGGWEFFIAAYIQKIVGVSILVYYLIAFSQVVINRKNAELVLYISKRKIKYNLFLLHITSYLFLLYFYILFIDPKYIISNPLSIYSILYALSPIIWFIYLLSTLYLIFPIRIIYNVISDNKLITGCVVLAIFTSLSNEFIDIYVNFWSSFLLRPSINLALFFLDIFSVQIQNFPDAVSGAPVFGTNKFKVEIWPACSGYEGMTLAIVLLFAYCLYYKKILRLSRALLILPIAAVAMFILNSIRIAILIAIGHFYSPDVALNGFHAVGGWINLLLVLGLSLYALEAAPFFKINNFSDDIFKKNNVLVDGTIFLIPLTLLILASLLTKSISSSFNWLYPIPIIISSLSIYFFRKKLLCFLEPPSISSIGIGIFVFLLWIYLIPFDKIQSEKFIDELSFSNMGFSLIWLLLRALGSAIIVPISEELAFRGYIQPYLQIRLNNSLFSTSSKYLALIITSILFGILHSDVYPAILAGLFFGLSYIRRNKLVDAITSHIITNSLLAAYILYFGYWSYW